MILFAAVTKSSPSPGAGAPGAARDGRFLISERARHGPSQRPGTPLVDDRPGDAGADHQLPDPQHARRGRPDAAPGAPHLRRASTPGSSAPSRSRSCCSRSAATCSTCSGSSSASPSSRSPGRSSAWRTALAHNWQMLGRAARPAGLGRRLGQPGGHEGHRGMVPGARARARRRALQHRRLVRLDARAAAGRLGDPQLRLAVGLRDHRRRSGWSGSCSGSSSIDSPDRHPRSRAEERPLIAAGQEPHLAGETAAPVARSTSLRQRNFWGIALPRFLADPTWGTLTFWVPLYLSTVAALRPQADRAVRLDAVPGRGPRLPVRRRHRLFLQRRGVIADQCAPLGLHRSAR